MALLPLLDDLLDEDDDRELAFAYARAYRGRETAMEHRCTPESSPSAPLLRDDLGVVVGIDTAIEAPFATRLLRAARRPPRCASRSCTRSSRAWDDKGLAGYILARVLEGEFGRTEPGLRSRRSACAATRRRQRVGARLFDALFDYGRRHGMADVRTQAAWTNHAMLRWLDAMGFTLAPNHVVDCAVAGGAYFAGARRSGRRRDRRGTGTRDRLWRQPGNDFERLARDDADVRAMDWDDLADGRAHRSRDHRARSPRLHEAAALPRRCRSRRSRVSLTRAPRRRRRRIPDGAGGPGRLRPRRTRGGHRHHRRAIPNTRIAASATLSCRSSSSISARCASSAWRPCVAPRDFGAPRLSLRRRVRSVAAAAVRAAARVGAACGRTR